MQSNQFGVHEIVDMRELLNFKVACLSQSKERLEKVENPELKQLVEQSVKQGKLSLNGMKDILTSASTQIN